MKNKDIILQTDDINIIKKAKGVGITTFLFPVTSFTVGYQKTYNLDEIKEEAFILINRNLDNEDIDKLKVVLKELPSNIKGIVFEDLGLINVLKDLDLIKVYNAKHLNCSSLSVNNIMDYVDTVILSTDLTYEEITTILNQAKKQASIYAFGLNNIFYSRRTLISNYSKEYNVSMNKELEIKEDISKENFKVVENSYGTVFYSGKYYDALRLFKEDSIKYYFVNLAYLDNKNANLLLDNFHNNDYSLNNMDIMSSSYNLDKGTYYKLPPKEGDQNV